MLIVPAIVFEPYARVSGPLITSTPSAAEISILTAWSAVVLDISPSSNPSLVIKNLSPEYPLNIGLCVACPEDLIAIPDSPDSVVARSLIIFFSNLLPTMVIEDGALL